MKLSADAETRSPVDLKKCGAYVYFEHPDTRVLMLAYRIDGGDLRLWNYPDHCPADLAAAIEAGAVITAWNAQFETLCFDWLHRVLGWPKPRYEVYLDTAAAAAAMALPRALGDAAKALGLDVEKDAVGKRLIQKFSKPRRARKGEEPGLLYWNEPEDHPEDYALFQSYCRRDVEVEEGVADKILPLSPYEQEIWLLDQRINRRGLRIDRASARASLDLADKAKKHLDREMRLVTGGCVPSTTQPGKLVEWVQAQDVALPSAAKAEITELLTDKTLPDNVRRAVEIRQEAAKTSVSKLKAMVDRASADSRVRGSFLYCGAGTGRWTSMGVNFANMPRPRKEFEKAREDGGLDFGALFSAFRMADPDFINFSYGSKLGRPLDLVSDAIRGFVWAGPGKEFVQADYTSIEGAVTTWLANEGWKLQALRELIDDPTLPDMYRRAAASIMNMTTEVITKKHPLRQSVGKVPELALGFGGGVSAFYSMSRLYNVDLDPLYGPVWEAAPESRRERATKRYETCLKRGDSKTGEMSREAWIACELIKIGWRESNPATVAAWGECEDAIRAAIENPGKVFPALKLKYLVRRGFLWCQLPSGRCLAYGSPRLSEQVWARKFDEEAGQWLDAEVMLREEALKGEALGKIRIDGSASPKASVLGVDAVTKKWGRFALYGGLAFQNAVQAIARDILVNGMLKVEPAGYEIVAHVYDEVVAEVPRGFGSVEEFERLLCELPIWAAGLPLTASGWRGKRYRKD